MKSKFAILLNISILLMISACVPVISAENQGSAEMDESPDPADVSNVVVVSPSIGPSMETIKEGETLVVQIPTIPEEGFNWVVDEFDTSILVQQGEAEYTADTAPESAGGIVQFTFVAVATGETPLNFTYTQDEGVFSKDTFGMTVTVIGAGSKTITVTMSPTGNSATLGVGDRLVVEIPTIPEEGCLWMIQDMDELFLEQIGDGEYIEDADEVSGGGMTQFQFLALSNGETSLTFELAEMSPDTSEYLVKDTFGVQVFVE